MAQYTYDEYGNLANDGTYEYLYDSYNYNRLWSTSNIKTKKYVLYDYYYDGLRKSKGNTFYIWLDGNMVYEFTSDDSSTYTYGHRLLSSDDAKYVLNAHGDVVALLDAAGSVTKRYDYDAFGNELNIDSADTNPFRYCAEYFDSETGTIYLRARYYSPVIGRFTQIDPIKDGLNWYAYCGNNPVVFVDPLGLYYIIDNGNGTYTLEENNFFTIFTAWVPSIISYSAESIFNVVEGSSVTSDENVVNDLIKTGISDYLKKNKGMLKGIGKHIGYIGAAISAVDTFTKVEENLNESIVFDLLERNNFSLISNSITHLKEVMQKSSNYITKESDYYIKNILGVNKSLYEIDKSLRNSKKPGELMNKYVKSFRGTLNAAWKKGQFFGNIDIEISTFKSNLSKYTQRLDYYDSKFSSMINY